jgi:hypothetical protein
MDQIDGSGIVVMRGRDGSRLAGVCWSSSMDVVLRPPNVTALLKTLLPSRPSAYRVGSGAAHSQPWVLDDGDAFNLETQRFNWRLDPLALVGSVDLAISASVLAMEAFAAMLGQDPRQERAKAQRRERAVSLLVGMSLSSSGVQVQAVGSPR